MNERLNLYLEDKGVSILLTDNDPAICAWLRELVRAGHLSGDVLERDITTMEDDLSGYQQAHFFAGIGGWPLALQWAGWPADWPVWSGSCPCQPFSSAGKRLGAGDERHLWPAFFSKVRRFRPPFILGEQVAFSEVVGTQLEADFFVAVQRGNFARANKLAKRLVASSSFHFHPRWLDRVRADLEAEGYAFRWEVLGAHSVRSPHIRQRLFWVAYALSAGWAEGRAVAGSGPAAGCCGDHLRLGDTQHLRTGERPGGGQGGEGIGRDGSANAGGVRGGLGDTGCPRPSQQCGRRQQPARPAPPGWDDYTIVRCVEPTRDGGTREVYRRAPVEPEFQPLAYGLPARVVRLRGYGNAIVPQVAATFVRAFLDSITTDRGAAQ